MIRADARFLLTWKNTEGLTILPFGVSSQATKVPVQARAALTPVTRLLSVKTGVTWFTCDVNSHSQTSEVIQGALSNFWELSHLYFSIHWPVWFSSADILQRIDRKLLSFK